MRTISRCGGVEGWEWTGLFCVTCSTCALAILVCGAINAHFVAYNNPVQERVV